MNYVLQMLNDILSALLIGLPIVCIMIVSFLTWNDNDIPDSKKRGK
jgi:hypothetical protein